MFGKNDLEVNTTYLSAYLSDKIGNNDYYRTQPQNVSEKTSRNLD